MKESIPLGVGNLTHRNGEAPAERSQPLRYGGAVLLVAIAALLRYWLARSFGLIATTYITFYPAVVLAAVLAGLGPGIFATVLSAAVVWYFFLHPAGWGAKDIGDVIAMAVFLGTGIGLSAFVESRDRTRRRAAEALRQTILYNRSLIEASLDPLVTISPEGRITDVNRATEQATGLPRSTLVGTDFSSYFTEPDKARAGYSRVFKQGQVTDYALVLRHASGKLMDVLYNASLYRDESGTVAGVFAAARDVTERKAADERLSFLSAIIDSSEDAIVGKDLDGTVRSWNPGAERLYGYVAAEMVGRPIALLAPPERTGEIAGILDKIAAGGVLPSYETERVRKDGRRVQVAITVAPIRDGTGRIRGVSTISHDISDRKQAEAKVRQAALYNRSLIEASLDPLVTISPEGRISDVNRATEQATGLPRSTLVGTDFSSYFTDPDKARAGYSRVFEQGQVTDYALILRHASGKLMDVLYNASLYRDESGAVAGVFAAARDVSERKRAEQELAVYHQHLEELVAQRTSEIQTVNQNLESANYRLEGANKELETFAYSVSHDLRTPLRAVDGFSRILVEDYAPQLDAEGRRIVGVIRDSTRKMAQLIDDILAFSRVGRLELSFRPVNMCELVEAALKELAPALAGGTVRVDIRPLPPSYGDGPMILRLWTNLLDNAVKFTRTTPGGVVEVGAQDGENETVYYVKDNGVGFDMQYAGKLFGVFQRLHGQEEFPGTGIGLAIVKRIVARHGGRVWAEGKLQHGATIYFALPKEPNHEREQSRGG